MVAHVGWQPIGLNEQFVERQIENTCNALDDVVRLFMTALDPASVGR
jgi:hypothetical protein